MLQALFVSAARNPNNFENPTAAQKSPRFLRSVRNTCARGREEDDLGLVILVVSKGIGLDTPAGGPPGGCGRIGRDHRSRQGEHMRDISLLLATPKHRDNPDFLMAADALGRVVTCFSCGRVIGAGHIAAVIESDVLENGTGVFMKGNWFCSNDAPSDGHPPVPSRLQKHKSPANRAARR